MPWYAWLIIALALGMIVGNILLLRDSATKPNLTDEQLKRIKERNAALDAKEKSENDQ